MPLVALLGLVHLRVALAFAILGRAGCCNQRGVDGRAVFERQPFGGQRAVDGGQYLQAELVLFERWGKRRMGSPRFQCNK